MADMVEKVARAVRRGRFERNGRLGSFDEKIRPNHTEVEDARAALEACHHEELVEALEEINVMAQAVTNAGKNAKTIWIIRDVARAVLAKVEASDA